MTEGSRPRRGRLWARRPEIWESRSDVERIANLCWVVLLPLTRLVFSLRLE